MTKYSMYKSSSYKSYSISMVISTALFIRWLLAAATVSTWPLMFDCQGALFGSLIGFGMTAWVSLGAYITRPAGTPPLPTSVENCTRPEYNYTMMTTVGFTMTTPGNTSGPPTEYGHINTTFLHRPISISRHNLSFSLLCFYLPLSRLPLHPHTSILLPPTPSR